MTLYTITLSILQELRAKLDLLSVPNDVWEIEHVGHDTQAVCRHGAWALIGGRDTLSLHFTDPLLPDQKEAAQEIFEDMKPLCMELPGGSARKVTVIRLERR